MLSVADILVAISHMWGATQNINKFILETTTNSSYSDTQCTAQAVFAVFGSLSSSMWTLALVSCVFVMYCMQGMQQLDWIHHIYIAVMNLHLEKFFAFSSMYIALMDGIFIPQIMIIHKAYIYGNVYHMGKNLFHENNIKFSVCNARVGVLEFAQ